MSEDHVLTDKQQRFLKNYQKAGGHISNACNATGINRLTYYNWKEANPLFKDAVEEIDEAILDDAEKCWLKKSKKDWKAAEALLSRRRPKKFNLKVIEKEHGAEGEEKVEPNNITINVMPRPVKPDGHD